jgi:hypothetical protein
LFVAGAVLVPWGWHPYGEVIYMYMYFCAIIVPGNTIKLAILDDVSFSPWW